MADITAGNGAIHSIDEVLFPNWDLPNSNEIRSNEIQSKVAKPNLAVLCRDLGLTAFADALTTTKMDKVIDHEGTFTVSAPSNKAFNHPKAYPKGYTLAERVQFHIGRGVVKPEKVQDGDKMMSLLSKRFITFNVYDVSIGPSPLFPMTTSDSVFKRH